MAFLHPLLSTKRYDVLNFCYWKRRDLANSKIWRQVTNLSYSWGAKCNLSPIKHGNTLKSQRPEIPSPFSVSKSKRNLGNWHFEHIRNQKFTDPIWKMGALCTLVDATLFVFFLFISIVAPLIDGQTCLPAHLFPPFLVELKSSYAHDYGDYLISENPHFFVGNVWFELVFQWPLAVASVYGIAAGKSWVSTTCLMYGASTLTSMVNSLLSLFPS